MYNPHYDEYTVVKNKIILNKHEQDLIENTKTLIAAIADEAQTSKHIDEHLIAILGDIYNGLTELNKYNNEIIIDL